MSKDFVQIANDVMTGVGLRAILVLGDAAVAMDRDARSRVP
jgi:hypothetical protein